MTRTLRELRASIARPTCNHDHRRSPNAAAAAIAMPALIARARSLNLPSICGGSSLHRVAGLLGWASCGGFPASANRMSTLDSRQDDRNWHLRQNQQTLPRFPGFPTPLDRYGQVRKLTSSKPLRRCSQVAKAADCKSAIVGSTPTSASSAGQRLKAAVEASCQSASSAPARTTSPPSNRTIAADASN